MDVTTMTAKIDEFENFKALPTSKHRCNTGNIKAINKSFI